MWWFYQKTHFFEAALRVKLRASGEAASAAPPDAMKEEQVLGFAASEVRRRGARNQPCAARTMDCLEAIGKKTALGTVWVMGTAKRFASCIASSTLETLHADLRQPASFLAPAVDASCNAM